MPLTIKKRSNGVYRVRGTHHGVTVDKSAKTRSRSEALAVKERWEREIFERVVLGKYAPRSFAEAALDYQHSGGEFRYMTPLLDAFGERDVRELRQSDLDRAARKAYPTAKPSTLNRQFYTPFIAVMRLAARNDHCDARDWSRPKQPQGRTDWRTPDEMERILGELKPRMRAMAEFMLATFPRITEAVSLQWRDISPGSERVTFWETKGGYPRHVDLSPRAQAALPERGEPTEHVWLSDKHEKPWTRSGPLSALKRACEAAEVEPLGPHTLRHTGATWRYALNRDLPRLMTEGGWKSLAMVQRYVHGGTDDLAEMLRAKGWAKSGQSGAANLNFLKKNNA